jgi:glycerophosphoryl diester phosphodiesterase
MASRIQPYSIIGHRGAPYLVPPGNTLSSLLRAIEVGAQMLEVDVRHTQDDVLVVNYEAVRSLGGHETPLAERPNDEWQEHAADTGAPLPTLTEVFDLARHWDVGLMLDFKEPGTEALLARAIRRSGLPFEQVLVTGAGESNRQLFRGLDPRIPLSLSLEEGGIDAKLLGAIDTDAVTWHPKLLTPAVVKVLRLRGILVYAKTVNSQDEMRRLRDVCKVDGIVTDSPDILKALPA